MKLFSLSGNLGWRRALKSDVPALSAFLEADETKRVGFSGRLLAGEGGEAPTLRLPGPLSGAVWILDGPQAGAEAPAIRGAPTICGAVLCHPSRLVFPIFPEGKEFDRGLALLVGSFSPASVIGMTGDVARYESLLGLVPRVSVDYSLMTRAGAPAMAPREVVPLAYPGLGIRRASLSDLDALMSLQEAYEREEVLTSVHEFNLAACRASLARALERQLILVAEEYGIFVGKAGTNARGFGVDQVGGVYTLPERRGRGVATALMAALLEEIGGSLKRPALFVKPSNAAALALYRSLGFEGIGDYRADYFEP